MGSVSLCFLYLALFVLCITAQLPDFVELQAVRVLNDPNIISMAPMGGERECYKPVLILRNSPTNCLASFNRTLTILPNGTEVATYNTVELGCPAAVVGSTRVECNGCDETTANTAVCPDVHHCWALNPLTKKLVVLHQNGSVFREVDLPTNGMANPYTFTVRQSFIPGRHQTYMLIGAHDTATRLVFNSTTNTTDTVTYPITTIWYSTWYLSGYTHPPTQHGTITAYDNFTSIAADIEGTALSLHFLFDQNYLVAKKGAKSLDFYEFYQAEKAGDYGEFYSIQAVTRDALGDFHVYDDDAFMPCIKVVEKSNAYHIRNIYVPELLKYVSTSRQVGFGVDATGIVAYEEDYSFEITYTNRTCDATGSNLNKGSITAHINGGNFPYSILSQPDGIRNTISYSGQTRIEIATGTLPQGRNVTLLDEGQIHRNLAYAGDVSTRRWWATADEIQPRTGNVSFAFKLHPFISATGQGFGFRCAFTSGDGCLSGKQFRYMEFYINIGKGGQHFSFGTLPLPIYEVKPGDWPTNTWIKFRYDIVKEMIVLPALVQGFGNMQFIDLSGSSNTNPIYIDDWTLTPHEFEFPSRGVFIKDGCNRVWEEVIPLKYEPMEVEIIDVPVSCNSNTTIIPELAHDGSLVANVTRGGKAPFIYKWEIDPSTASALHNRAASTAHITVYENGLNSSWADASFAQNYSLQSTRFYRSPPYSIEYTPILDRDGIVFQVYPEIAYNEFHILEFWINGGDFGSQTISAYLGRAFDTGTMTQNTIAANAKFFELLPNTWTKVTLESQNTNAANGIGKFNMIGILSQTSGVAQLSNMSTAQPAVYIDDIVLMGKSSILTVTDASGCKVSVKQARVTSPTPLKQTVQVTNAKCYGVPDGVVSITMEGGEKPYTYEWLGSSVTDSTLTGINETIVYFNATDSKSCKFKPSNVTVLQPPPISVDVRVRAPECYGGPGRATASAVGGAGVYTFNWLALNAGQPKVILQSAPEPLFSDSVANGLTLLYGEVLCRGTGSHLHLPYLPTQSGYCALSVFNYITTAFITGSQFHFNPQKYNKIIFWAMSDSVDALNAAAISLTLNGTNVKSHQVNFTTINQAPLEANKWIKFEVPFESFVLGNSKPEGLAFDQFASMTLGRVFIDDLSIVPIISSGAGFAMLPGFPSTIEVSAADYILTVVDGNGCSYVSSVNVSQPDQINLVAKGVAPTTQDGKDGSISLQVSGGNYPYVYQWLDLGFDSASPEFHGLASGTYNLRVWDNKNCSRDFQVFVERYSSSDHVSIRKYNSKLSSGLAALVGVGFLLSLFSATMLYRYWLSFSTLGSFLSCMILVGCVLAYLAALVLLPEPTDALCVSFIWFLGIGFVLVYGCLFIKTWALYQVWRNAVRYQKANLTPLYIIKCLCLAVTVEIIFLAIWTAIDPPTVHLMKTVDNTAEYQCNTDNITFWVIFLVAKGAWLIFGAVLSVLTRNIAKEYNESSSIAYAIYNNVLLGAIAIPLAVLLGEVPGGRLTVEVVIITIAFTFTMVVVFFKIWHSIMLPEKIVMSNSEMRKKNTASSTARSSTSVDRSRDSKGSPTMSGKGSDSATDAAV